MHHPLHNLPNSNGTSTGFHAVVETPEGISYVADRPVLIITNALGRKAGADRADPPSGSVRAVCFESVSHEDAV